MVAHSKHHKPARRKSASRPARKGPATRLSAHQPLPEVRPPVVQEEEIPKDDEEPRPEDLAKEEEALKTQEAEEAAAATAAQETEEATGTRGRERASYDGDTAIKLYLREIGQVKLLTPQEEIDLAAKIKKGDKKAREQ